MKHLAKKLNENPVASRCANVPECVEEVKKRKRPTVLIHVKKKTIHFIFQIMFISKIMNVFLHL